MNFESTNPRTNSFVNPFNVKDSAYAREYRRMALRSMFPAGLENGLFHTMVGVFICIAGLTALMFQLSHMQVWIGIAVGVVLGCILSYLYVRYMQVKVLFPRGAQMAGTNGKPSILAGLACVVICIALPVYAYFNGSSMLVHFIIGSVFALINVLAYIKTGRNSLLYAALACLIMPMLLTYFRFNVSSDVYTVILATVPYEGMVFVIAGLMYIQKAVMYNPNRHNRDKLQRYLTSTSSSKQFCAATFLCNSIDPVLLPELLQLAQSDNFGVSYTAQIAIGNTWGPRPRESVNIPTETPALQPMLPNNDSMASDYQERYQQHMAMQAQMMEAQRQNVLDRFLKHYKIAEEQMVKICSEDSQAQEDLFALIDGQNLHYQQAQTVAVELLGSARTPRAYAKLMDIMQHTDKRMGDAAIIGFYGADSKAVLYLEKFFVASSSWLRRRAINATQRLLDYLLVFEPNEAAVAYALLENDIEGLFATDDTNTFAATIGLLPGDTDEELDEIEEYCENDRPIIKIEAMRALARLAPDRAESWVLSSANSYSASVRYAAIKLAERLNLKEGPSMYQRLSSDRSAHVAQAAQEASARYEASLNPNHMFYDV